VERIGILSGGMVIVRWTGLDRLGSVRRRGYRRRWVPWLLPTAPL